MAGDPGDPAWVFAVCVRFESVPIVERRSPLAMSSLTPVEEKYTTVKQLIELGKEKGYLLYDEIYESLPEEGVSLPDELDETYIRFAGLGIDVSDRPERYQNRDDLGSGRRRGAAVKHED